jgi:hypothetical protein
MMPEHSRLFEQPGQQLRRGQNIRIRGYGGLQSLEVEAHEPEPVPVLPSEFVGAWAPTVSGTDLELSAGSINDGVTTFLPTVTGLTLSSGLNYVYLRCTLDHIEEDGYEIGGTITATSIEISSTTQVSDATYGRILLCTVDTDTGEVVRYQWFNFSAQVGASPTFNYWYS